MQSYYHFANNSSLQLTLLHSQFHSNTYAALTVVTRNYFLPLQTHSTPLTLLLHPELQTLFLQHCTPSHSHNYFPS
ncbi:hypothetical protein Hanom_Chr14g01304781 [Helianthus anomalus]